MSNDTQDRERISKAAFVYGSKRAKRQCSTSNEYLDLAVAHYLHIGAEDGYVEGASSEAAHWEERVKGLVDAIERNHVYCSMQGNCTLDCRPLCKALLAFHASADDASEGK